MPSRVGRHALQRLHDMKDRRRLIGDVRERGLLLNLELLKDRASREPATAAAERVLYRALSRGLFFKTTLGKVLTLTLPLIVSQDQMDQSLGSLEVCLAKESLC